MRSRYVVGLGANIGQPEHALLAALIALEADGRTRIRARSSLYRSAPIESAGPDFLNAVIEIDSELCPRELLERLQSIERAAGRERPYRNAPRTLDLDLLLAGDRVIEEEGLSVPHPRMHQRAFVMRPLLELLPDVDIPGRGRASALLAGCADQRIERMGAFGQADTASPPNRIEPRQTGTRQS